MGSPDDRCVTVAARQHGCLSRAQGLRAGLSGDGIARRCRTGRWTRVLPGVYVIAGAPVTWEQRYHAVLLWSGEGAALSHGSAAWLWRLPDSAPDPLEISHGGSKRARPDVVVHRVCLGAEDVTAHAGLRVTTPARTLVDIAGRLRPWQFDAIFHHCLHHRLTTLQAIEAAAAARSRRPGSATVRGALETYSNGRPAASALEARVVRLLRQAELPRPQRQHEVVVGGRLRYLDFAWPERRVALEVDGYQWHSSRSAWERDRGRLRELRRAGWTVVTATHDDVREGAALVAELAATLAR